MKKIRGIILLTIVLILTGCTKAGRYDHFTKEEQSLSWRGERQKSFGDSDYSNLKTEEEAFVLIKEKYKLAVPDYYEQSKTTLKKYLSSKAVQASDAQYSVFAKNKELEFRTIYPFYKEKELQIIAEVQLNYAFSCDQKEAYLKSQLVKIKIAPTKGTLPNDNLSECIKAVGENMQLPEKVIQNGLAGYEKRVKETSGAITDDYLPVVSTAASLNKKQEFFKEIALVYDQEGTVREIYSEISDQNE